MPARSLNPTIATLRDQIARMEGGGGPTRGALPFGVPALDRRLPQGGLLPFVTIETAGVQDDLRDFLLRRAGPVSVEGPQHSSQPCALLTGQARVW